MMVQIPDKKPGFYYVTAMRENGDAVRLVGPFVNDHAGALGMVDKAKKIACELDFRAAFYAFGTARADDDLGAGKLNENVGFKADAAAVAA